MPLDLQAELNRRKMMTDQLLSQQNAGIGGSIDARRAELEGFRNSAFQPLAGSRLEGLGLSPTGAGMAEARTRLAREAERGYNRSAFDSGRDNLNKRYELAGNRQQQAQSGVDDANAFIRQFSNQDTANRFQETESAKDRVAALQREDMADQFAQQGLAMQDQYAPKMDWESALTRSLFGLGGSAATSWYLGRKTPAPSVPLSNDKLSKYFPTSGQNGINNQSLRERTGFSPFTKGGY